MDEILKKFGGAENIWNAIQNNAAKVGIEVARTMLELFYVLKSPQTDMIDKTLIVAALGYQLLPEDALPREKYGFLGFLDNGVTLAFAYRRVKSSITPEIEHQVNNILESWFDTSSMNEFYDSHTTRNTNIEGYKQENNSAEDQVPYHKFNSNGGNDNRSVPHSQKRIWNDEEDVIID